MRPRGLMSWLMAIAGALVALAGLMTVLGLLGNGGLSTRPPGFLARLRTFLTTNVAETSTMPDFPELAVRSYDVPRPRLAEAVDGALADLGWEIVSRSGDTIRAVVTTALFRFKDDVEIRLRPDGDAWQVQVRSRSRVGQGDLGANLRHVVDLYAALNVQLGRSAPRDAPRAAP